MRLRSLPILFVASLLLAGGCATPVAYTTQPMTRLDQHAEYAVEDFDGGFTLTILYQRYQFIPESDAVDNAASSQLLSLAHDIADRRGKALKPLNEQRVKKSMGRNGLTGITSWTGTVKAFYSEEQ